MSYYKKNHYTFLGVLKIAKENNNIVGLHVFKYLKFLEIYLKFLVGTKKNIQSNLDMSNFV